MKPAKFAAAGVVLSLLIAVGVWHFTAKGDEPKPQLGLMTSLPIYWSGQPEFGAALTEESEPHWIRAQLEEGYSLLPLDTLAEPDSAEPSVEFGSLDTLLLAQPAPLPPADFAALDQWVREGGRLLLFADPVLTEHSEYGFGDRRRPQAIAMLGPILSRWGLSLEVGPEHDEVLWRGYTLPVEAPGALVAQETEFAQCALEAGGLIADCAIGQGRALIVADAALLDAEQHLAGADEAILALVSAAFERP